LPAYFWNWCFIGSAAVTALLYPKIYALLFDGPRQLATFGLPATYMWHDAIYMLAISGLLIGCIHSGAAIAALANRVMVFLGRISYSIYLLHEPVIGWLKKGTALVASPLLFLIITIVATILISTITYYLIELPGQRLGRRSPVASAAPAQA
jgi:peptidoglycan/LPS O-acetylase OafA/YrhL